MSHILTVSNLQVCSDNEFDSWLEKVIFFQNNVPYKALGVADSAKKLKIPNSLCLVHMNR